MNYYPNNKKGISNFTKPIHSKKLSMRREEINIWFEGRKLSSLKTKIRNAIRIQVKRKKKKENSYYKWQKGHKHQNKLREKHDNPS